MMESLIPHEAEPVTMHATEYNVKWRLIPCYVPKRRLYPPKPVLQEVPEVNVYHEADGQQFSKRLVRIDGIEGNKQTKVTTENGTNKLHQHDKHNCSMYVGPTVVKTESKPRPLGVRELRIGLTRCADAAKVLLSAPEQPMLEGISNNKCSSSIVNSTKDVPARNSEQTTGHAHNHQQGAPESHEHTKLTEVKPTQHIHEKVRSKRKNSGCTCEHTECHLKLPRILPPKRRRQAVQLARKLNKTRGHNKKSNGGRDRNIHTNRDRYKNTKSDWSKCNINSDMHVANHPNLIDGENGVNMQSGAETGLCNHALVKSVKSSETANSLYNVTERTEVAGSKADEKGSIIEQPPTGTKCETSGSNPETKDRGGNILLTNHSFKPLSKRVLCEKANETCFNKGEPYQGSLTGMKSPKGTNLLTIKSYMEDNKYETSLFGLPKGSQYQKTTVGEGLLKHNGKGKHSFQRKPKRSEKTRGKQVENKGKLKLKLKAKYASRGSAGHISFTKVRLNHSGLVPNGNKTLNKMKPTADVPRIKLSSHKKKRAEGSAELIKKTDSPTIGQPKAAVFKNHKNVFSSYSVTKSFPKQPCVRSLISEHSKDKTCPSHSTESSLQKWEKGADEFKNIEFCKSQPEVSKRRRKIRKHKGVLSAVNKNKSSDPADFNGKRKTQKNSQRNKKNHLQSSKMQTKLETTDTSEVANKCSAHASISEKLVAPCTQEILSPEAATEMLKKDSTISVNERNTEKGRSTPDTQRQVSAPEGTPDPKPDENKKPEDKIGEQGLSSVKDHISPPHVSAQKEVDLFEVSEIEVSTTPLNVDVEHIPSNESNIDATFVQGRNMCDGNSLNESGNDSESGEALGITIAAVVSMSGDMSSVAQEASEVDNESAVEDDHQQTVNIIISTTEAECMTDQSVTDTSVSEQKSFETETVVQIQNAVELCDNMSQSNETPADQRDSPNYKTRPDTNANDQELQLITEEISEELDQTLQATTQITHLLVVSDEEKQLKDGENDMVVLAIPDDPSQTEDKGRGFSKHFPSPSSPLTESFITGKSDSDLDLRYSEASLAVFHLQQSDDLVPSPSAGDSLSLGACCTIMEQTQPCDIFETVQEKENLEKCHGANPVRQYSYNPSDTVTVAAEEVIENTLEVDSQSNLQIMSTFSCNEYFAKDPMWQDKSCSFEKSGDPSDKVSSVNKANDISCDNENSFSLSESSQVVPTEETPDKLMSFSECGVTDEIINGLPPTPDTAATEPYSMESDDNLESQDALSDSAKCSSDAPVLDRECDSPDNDSRTVENEHMSDGKLASDIDCNQNITCEKSGQIEEEVQETAQDEPQIEVIKVRQSRGADKDRIEIDHQEKEMTTEGEDENEDTVSQTNKDSAHGASPVDSKDHSLTSGHLLLRNNTNSTSNGPTAPSPEVASPASEMYKADEPPFNVQRKGLETIADLAPIGKSREFSVGNITVNDKGEIVIRPDDIIDNQTLESEENNKENSTNIQEEITETSPSETVTAAPTEGVKVLAGINTPQDCGVTCVEPTLITDTLRKHDTSQRRSGVPESAEDVTHDIAEANHGEPSAERRLDETDGISTHISSLPNESSTGCTLERENGPPAQKHFEKTVNLGETNAHTICTQSEPNMFRIRNENIDGPFPIYLRQTCNFPGSMPNITEASDSHPPVSSTDMQSSPMALVTRNETQQPTQACQDQQPLRPGGVPTADAYNKHQEETETPDTDVTYTTNPSNIIREAFEAGTGGMYSECDMMDTTTQSLQTVEQAQIMSIVASTGVPAEYIQPIISDSQRTYTVLGSAQQQNVPRGTRGRRRGQSAQCKPRTTVYDKRRNSAPVRETMSSEQYSYQSSGSTYVGGHADQMQNQQLLFANDRLRYECVSPASDIARTGRSGTSASVHHVSVHSPESGPATTVAAQRYVGQGTCVTSDVALHKPAYLSTASAVYPNTQHGIGQTSPTGNPRGRQLPPQQNLKENDPVSSGKPRGLAHLKELHELDALILQKEEELRALRLRRTIVYNYLMKYNGQKGNSSTSSSEKTCSAQQGRSNLMSPNKQTSNSGGSILASVPELHSRLLQPSGLSLRHESHHSGIDMSTSSQHAHSRTAQASTPTGASQNTSSSSSSYSTGHQREPIMTREMFQQRLAYQANRRAAASSANVRNTPGTTVSSSTSTTVSSTRQPQLIHPFYSPEVAGRFQSHNPYHMQAYCPPFGYGHSVPYPLTQAMQVDSSRSSVYGYSGYASNYNSGFRS